MAAKTIKIQTNEGLQNNFKRRYLVIYTQQTRIKKNFTSDKMRSTKLLIIFEHHMFILRVKLSLIFPVSICNQQINTLQLFDTLKHFGTKKSILGLQQKELHFVFYTFEWLKFCSKIKQQS